MICHHNYDCCSHCAHELVQAKAKVAELSQSTFPMQGGPNISWKLANEIWLKYAEKHGKSQSLERMAERGGFSWAEVEVIYSTRNPLEFAKVCAELAETRRELSDGIPCVGSHEELLGNALCGVLVAAGVLSEGAAPTGPELLMFAEEYVGSEKKDRDRLVELGEAMAKQEVNWDDDVGDLITKQEEWNAYMAEQRGEPNK